MLKIDSLLQGLNIEIENPPCLTEGGGDGSSSISISSSIKYISYSKWNKNNNITLKNDIILITGIAGFIGMHTAKLLISNPSFNGKIIGIDNFDNYYTIKLKREREQLLNKLGVIVIHSDLCHHQKLLNILKKYQITIILHLAAQAGVRYSIKHPMKYITNNVQCTVNLFETVVKNYTKIPIVFASSSSVYGDNKKFPLKISQNLNHPKSLYAATKIATENIAYVYYKIYNLSIIGLRFFTVYGSYGRPDMATWIFTEKLMNNKTIKLYNNGKMERDFTHVFDISNGVESGMKFVKYLDKINNENFNSYFILNLGKGNVRNLSDFVNIIKENINKNEIDHLITLADTPGGEVLKTFADISKSKIVLNYQPKIELEEGIPQFLRWYQNEWIKAKKNIYKKKLIISAIYVIDDKDINYYKELINKWYKSIKKTIDLDIVIIHNGLEYELFNEFKNVIFVNYFGQNLIDIYDNYMEFLKESNENEYEKVIITDINVMTFKGKPFDILDDKNILIGFDQFKMNEKCQRNVTVFIGGKKESVVNLMENLNEKEKVITSCSDSVVLNLQQICHSSDSCRIIDSF